jgi:hypothetical protein
MFTIGQIQIVGNNFAHSFTVFCVVIIEVIDLGFETNEGYISMERDI